MSVVSEIKVQCLFNLEKLSNLISAKVSGQMITEQLRLDDLALKADSEWMYAIISVSGKHNGKIQAQFKLLTADATSDFLVEDISIKILEGGILAKGAAFVLRHFLGEKIETKVQEKIHDAIAQQIADLTARYSKVKLGEDGLQINTTLDHYNFDEIAWTEEELKIRLTTFGIINLELR